MNLALHGLLLQVILSILNFKHGFRLCSAGEPGYLDFDNLPETNFSCQGKVIGGYYADVEAGCQMFHVCTIGQKDEIMDIKFLCLNGTVFDQETRVCERVDEVDCSKSERFYNLNLELYGSTPVTLSLHEEEDEEDDDDSTELRDDHQQQHMTSARPSTTTSTTTTTPRSSQPSTTSPSNGYQQQQHQTGYSQHYQPRPAFSAVQTSQSNSHYDDKNGGYHHQYIFHSDERNNNNQATSYQLFSNRGVSSTTPTPQVHQQVRYSSSASPQVIHNEPSTVTPLQYHVQSTPSTIQTLLNNNGNNPPLINPIFHNHGVASTTEQFNVHNNNPREIAEYQDNSDDDDDDDEQHVERKPLEPIQSTNQGKVSKLTISPIPQPEKRPTVIQTKSSSQTLQQQRISINYLPTPSPIQTTISAFYPTQRSTLQNPQKPQNNQQVTQHIHVPPPPAIPQLKLHQITINLPQPDIQRIVQNPSPLLPSQSRVIVTAKASVSDESGRPLNASQLITLPIPTIPSNYDEYKEGDESFDPFYRDVPKIRNNRRIVISRKVEANGRNLRNRRSVDIKESNEKPANEEIIFDAEIKNIKDLKANLPFIKAILFGLPIPENRDVESESENDDNINTNIDDIVEEKEIISNSEIPIEENQSKLTNAHGRPISTQRYPEHRISSTIAQRRTNINPKVVESSLIDAEPKDTVQLFLSAVDGNNSLSHNYSHQIEQLNSSNETIDLNDKPQKIRPEVLQTRSSFNSNKPDRRRYQNDDSLEESEEFLPRRNSRIKSKPYRYYDDYDVSESIELGTRHTPNRLRQRPNERRLIHYRNDYIDQEDIEDEEYDEIKVNRKSILRKGPQGRRVSSRSQNRYYDYEDDIEIHEKPRLRNKNLNAPNRNRVRPASGRLPEGRRRRVEPERRRNGRRRPSVRPIENLPRNKTENIDEQTFKELISKPSIDTDVLEENKNSKFSLRNEKDEQPVLEEKKHHTSVEKEEQSIDELKRRDKQDLLNHRRAYTDQIVESFERGFSDDYADYADLRPHISRNIYENRKNRNRYDTELELKPYRNSRRRNKSRKFVEVEREKIEDKIKITTESTTPDDDDSKTTNIPTEYTIPDDVSAEYDDYGLDNSTFKVYDVENTDAQENIKTTTEEANTEGILKFTDEMPMINQKDDNEEKQKTLNINDQYRGTSTPNYDEYVDDNYEPESYVESKIKNAAVQETTEENYQYTTMPSQIKEIKYENVNRTENSNFTVENKHEYDEIYEDKIETTTASLSSEEYYDFETTSDDTTLPPTTSNPITKSTTTSTSSTTTIITTTTTTTTAIPLLTTSTSPSTTTTTSTPSISSSSVTPRSKATAKFFKPTAFRKNYVYNPISTTPNPVVIRRGQGLLGPKPTKPPLSYNELAPKPLIRRLPLLSRTTTTTSEATILEEKIMEEFSKESENLNKNHEEFTSSPESVTVNSISPSISLVKLNIEVTPENTDTTTKNTNNQIPLEETSTLIIRQNQKEKNFDTNEVPKQSFDVYDTNNVPQKSEDSFADTSKSEVESTTYTKDDMTVDIINSNSKIHDDQTTTARIKRIRRPSQRRKLEPAPVKTQNQKTSLSPQRMPGFNCLEKEMHRFHVDVRDCRLFHYCSPGFTPRQVLDFRFVCEEGTIFDEETQSCLYEVKNPKCVKRTY